MDSKTAEMISMIVILPVTFSLMAWALKTFFIFLQQRRVTKSHFELQGKLLDKLGATPETLQYLSSDQGARLVEATLRERSDPRGRVLTSIQIGIVLAFVSAAFLLLRGQVPDAAQGFAVIGALGLALGLGFLAAGWVALALAKTWGLINGGDHSSED